MAGERLDPPTYDWTIEKTGKPVVDHWWQTETGWAICGNLMGVEPMPPKPGSATLPSPGFNVQIVDEVGNELPAGVQGSIAIKLPLPPSCLPTVWGDFERFKSGYLSDVEGFYTSGDGGYKDEDGYCKFHGFRRLRGIEQVCWALIVVLTEITLLEQWRKVLKHFRESQLAR